MSITRKNISDHERAEVMKFLFQNQTLVKLELEGN